MKKFWMTIASTCFVTVATVRAFNALIEATGFWGYPEWVAYALMCVCACAGELIGAKLSKIKVNFRTKAKPYITKELL